MHEDWQLDQENEYLLASIIYKHTHLTIIKLNIFEQILWAKA